MSKLMLFGMAPVEADGFDVLGREFSPWISLLRLIELCGRGNSGVELMFFERDSDPELLLDVRLVVLSLTTTFPFADIEHSNSWKIIKTKFETIGKYHSLAIC